MKTIILTLAVLLFTSWVAPIDYSTIEEKTVHVQVNGGDDLISIQGEKAFYMAGDGASKLSIKGDVTTTTFSKGDELVFYVRGWSQVHGLPLSIVKMDLVKGKRVAAYKEGFTSDKEKLITSIIYKAVEVDREKKIYKVTLNDMPDLGTWCVNFHIVTNGKFMMGSGYGKEGFCFSIVE